MMVLSKDELLASLKNENRILLHLLGKVEPSHLDYRPTAKQRSTIELLRYLTMMGPALVKAGVNGAFDEAGWAEEEKAAADRGLAEIRSAIETHPAAYQKLLDGMPEADLRAQCDVFGMGFETSRGYFLVNQALASCAAYRTQLFLYLKACGREELNTWNLWGGVDQPAEG
ncbi:MAG: hypothetical protein KJ067_02330 [Vicinamibacteria bacterium]|jgi:hypothetical protein|nr:hypothetical protein [Vicinamibacteria bacterium]